jgi:hypothetical protein
LTLRLFNPEDFSYLSHPMRLVLWGFLFFVLIRVPAEAARPFVTDDARLTTAGSCQLDSWTRFYSNRTEVWALPACNPEGNLEFTLGVGHAHYQDPSLPGSEDYVLQAKTLFRPLETNGWGWGAAVGTVRHPKISPGPNLLGNTYINFPFSASFADDRVVMHLNTGWLHDKGLSRENLTWGIGTEINTTRRLMLVAESFGDNRTNPYWQAGLRYAIIPHLLEIDATAGRQMGNDPTNRWISFGLRLTPASLF